MDRGDDVCVESGVMLCQAIEAAVACGKWREVGGEKRTSARCQKRTLSARIEKEVRGGSGRGATPMSDPGASEAGLSSSARPSVRRSMRSKTGCFSTLRRRRSTTRTS